MKRFDFVSELKGITRTIIRNTDFMTEAANLDRKKNPAERLAGLPPFVREFYQQCNGYLLEWAHVRFEGNRFARGRVNLQHLDDVLVEGKGLLWFDHTPADDPIRNFRVLDYVTDEVFVGFFIGPEAKDMLYYYSISDTPQPLQLDLRGYVQMLKATYAFKFWQKAVLTILDGTLYPETATMQEYLPQLIDGFSYESIEQTFQSVKI